jgi:hypothetical protein
MVIAIAAYTKHYNIENLKADFQILAIVRTKLDMLFYRSYNIIWSYNRQLKVATYSF